MPLWQLRYETERDSSMQDIANEVDSLRAKVEATTAFMTLVEAPVLPNDENVAVLLSGRLGKNMLDVERVFQVFCECLTSKRPHRPFRNWFVDWTSGVIGLEDCTLQVDSVCVPFLLLMRSFRTTPRVEAIARQLFQTATWGGDDVGPIKSTPGTVWGVVNELLDELAKDPFVAAHPVPDIDD